MKHKLTGKQIAGNLLLFVGLIAITFYFLLRGQNPRELWQAVRSARVSFIAIAIGCMCVFVLCEGIATWQCLRLFGCRNKLSRNIFYALVGFFFSSVTPSASGGQPMQLYYMHRDTIAVPTATLALLVQFSVFQCVTIAFAAVGFGTQYAQLVQEGGAFRYAFLLGTAVNAALLVITLAIIFSKRASESILRLVIRLLTLIRCKKVEQVQQQLSEQLELYHRGTQYLRQNTHILCRVVGITIVQTVAFYTIPCWIAMALYPSMAHSFFAIAAMEAVLYVSVSALPLPGSIGASEGAFLLLFRAFIPGAALHNAMLLSRGVSFYLFVAGSGCSVALHHLFEQAKPTRKQIP